MGGFKSTSIQLQAFFLGFGCWALQIAIKLKKTAVIQTLLTNEVDPNAMARHQLILVFLGISKIVYRELALGIAISTTTSSDDSVGCQLLTSGANSNSIITEDSGYTALHKAVSHEWLLVVKELVNAGASVNGDTATSIFHTPL